MGWDSDVVVIIGTGGMGTAIARRIGSGRRLLLADVDATRVDAAATELRDLGHDVTTRPVDVADHASVAALADAASGLGRVTSIVHTAGLSPVQASTEAILRVDLLGVGLVLEEFVRVVSPGGAGVVIASMAGHLGPALPAEQERALAGVPAAELRTLPFLAPEVVGAPGAAYSLAKRANALQVQAAAGAWGRRGARINSISPGHVATPMGQQEESGENAETIRQLIAVSAAGRHGTPDDIAAAAAFLLGPDAAFITGTDLLVDGGAVAGVRTHLADTPRRG